MRPHWISPDAPPEFFPPVDHALREPNGLLAIGGDLSPPRLLAAYRQGIFPWYSEDQPILWWSPDPRAVLRPERLHVSRSLAKRLRRREFELTTDRAFAEVIGACAEPRPGQDGTWISEEMMSAYRRLHALGHAHSIECWAGGRLVGGLYGVAIGRVFFGESMFSRARDASKVALCALAAMPYALIDCQLPTDHLLRMGAELISRERFVALLAGLCAADPPRGARLR